MKLSVFLPFCSALTNDAGAELYHRYWIMLSEQWGDRELDEMTPGDIKMVAKAARRTAVTQGGPPPARARDMGCSTRRRG